MSFSGLISNIAKKIGGFLKPKVMTYAEMYSVAKIKPEKLSEVRWVAAKIQANKPRYEAVVLSLANGMPYWFVGVIHFMEGGGKFTRHLHNGDPLLAKTVNVPKGRPLIGKPPYSWEESAIDALTYMGYHKVTDWGIQNCLDLFEKYNGMGYKKKGLSSPYLWSYTQFYTKGKYVADGKYDPNAISKQPGVAAIMKELGV
jgi:lysozyme family protein